VSHVETAERLFVQPISNAYVHVSNKQGKLLIIYPTLSNQHLWRTLLTVNAERLFVQPIVNANVHIDNEQEKLQRALHTKRLSRHSNRLSAQHIHNGKLHINNHHDFPNRHPTL
jgi:hypothetical protein